METLNEMCELTPPCECGCNPDKDLSQGNIRPNYSPSPCGADSGMCGEHLLEHPLHLWAVKYAVEGYLKHIGVAVIQAPTRSAAECIFAKNSLFSGTPERLKILAMKEVMPWSEPILFEDSAAILDRHNLKSYPFLLKSDYEQNIQNIMETVINSIEEQLGEKVEITVDLSNYYNKSQTYSKEEVNELIDNIEDNDTKYTGSGDVEVNPTTHVISLKKQIPDPVDLSDYAKTEDLPKVHNGKLTISVNGQAIEFTANSENDVLLEIAIPENYTLPVATNEVLGGIKVGTNLSITPEGVLSAEKGADINDNTTNANTTWSSQKISTELQAAIRTFNSFNIVSVGVLPTTGVERTLYLVNKTSNDAQDVKDEYLWINNHWEKIGSAIINMNNYFTKEEIKNMLALLYQGDETTIHIGEDHVISLIPNMEVLRDLIPAQKQADWNETSESNAAFIKNKPQLKQVATSGSYNDLIDKPAIPQPVNADWESNGGLSEILNKPKLARVATSGSYEDLVNKPEIPQVTPQVQSDWNEQDDSSPAYIRNKPTSLEPVESDQEIRIVDASTINGSLANINTTAYKVNNIVVLTNTAESTTYAYTNSRNETKHISGNPDYDMIFRYCGNNKFQPITYPIPID